MKLNEVPLTTLRLALKATEQVVGRDSVEARAIREELRRRRDLRRPRRRGGLLGA